MVDKDNNDYDIYCPFIDIIFDNKYYINIPLKDIELNNIKNDYILFINKYNDKLYSININYDDYEKQLNIYKELNKFV